MTRRFSCLLMLLSATAAQAQAPSYNRDVRPILSDACFHCHGPDSAKRKAKLDLSDPENARDALVLERIEHVDPAKRMPPDSRKKPLTPGQIDTLKRWIAAGAAYENHWAFAPPTRPKLPPVKDRDWCQNPIDYFILERLEKAGMKPSPEADRVTLLRRVSFDLTGLPPTPDEVDAFVQDKSLRAYEKVVERLLASPRFGERMAQRWLDAARYADTNGYQTDGERTMWRWRDWVIGAFNANMPFDQFTLEQIAGDMLPNPTLEQQIATGFNRNHRGNSEGGIIPEEYAVEYVADRVDTTSTVWLGLTMGCVKCHHHKYDPIRHDEFYRLFAYFNNVPEKGKAIKYGNSPPYIKAPTPAQRIAWTAAQDRVTAAERAWTALQSRIADEQQDWEKLASKGQVDWTYDKNALAILPVELREPEKTGRLEGKQFGDFGFMDAFTISVWMSAWKNGGPLFSRMSNTDRAEGYSVVLTDGRLHVNLVKRWLDDAIRLKTEDRIDPTGWRHVALCYDGSRLASGVQIFVDGRPMKLRVLLDDLNQSFKTNEPFRTGAGGGKMFDGKLSDPRIYFGVVPGNDVALLANRDRIESILKIPAEKRSTIQARKLRTYYLDRHASAPIRKAHENLDASRRDLVAFEKALPTTMVMEEMPTPRLTHLLIRGEYDKPGQRVDPGIPAIFGPLPKNLPNNRLGFARWLTDKSNPLTARVAVNRHWQMLFGGGLVKTVEDFGAQGDWPSHPELLDWLASEFMEPSLINCCRIDEPLPQSWDVKHLLKAIVTSAAYRQSSRFTEESLRLDPENRLLSRGPRQRLAAEMIRDQALFVAGLLHERIGGPSVRIPQPVGLVRELHGVNDDAPLDRAPEIYRRGLYVFWKRTVAPPSLTTFDAANRETCVVRDSRTNTPLQALNLLNDPAYIEAARNLAERAMLAKKSPEDRVEWMFRLATCRTPSPRESAILRESLLTHRRHFESDGKAAARFLAVGESRRDPSLSAVELAAYTTLANMLLNLDEVITKE